MNLRALSNFFILLIFLGLSCDLVQRPELHLAAVIGIIRNLGWPLCPGINDDVIISSGDSVVVNVTSSCNKLSMKGNARLQVDNPLTITTILDVRPTANSQTCRVHADAHS